MTKKLFLFSFIALSAISLSAQNFESSSTASNIAILITLVVALLALVLTVINSFRISHLKKVGEVDHINLKDDLNVTVEAVKVSLTKEIRGVKRELGKSVKPRNNNNRKPKNEEKQEDLVTETDSDNKKAAKRPYKKRNPNYRRRPAKKQENTEAKTVKSEKINE